MKNYADGKVHTKTEKIVELEKLYGIDKLSPFGTNDKEVFEEKLSKLDIFRMNTLAAKVGARIVADLNEQRTLLRTAFAAYATNNSPVTRPKQSAPLEVKDKKVMEALDYARTKSVFEKEFPSDNLESFKKLLNTYTLADLQNLAAKCGFNPSFERKRIVHMLTSEFEKDFNLRVK